MSNPTTLMFVIGAFDYKAKSGHAFQLEIDEVIQKVHSKESKPGVGFAVTGAGFGILGS